MADLVINGDLVLAVVSSVGVVRFPQCGYSGTAGLVVYKDAADLKPKLSDANGAAATRKVLGIALNPAAVDQPLDVFTFGEITIGATLVAGASYYLSANVGKICPAADVVAGMNAVFLGIARSTTVLYFNPSDSGVQL